MAQALLERGNGLPGPYQKPDLLLKATLASSGGLVFKAEAASQAPAARRGATAERGGGGDGRLLRVRREARDMQRPGMEALHIDLKAIYIPFHDNIMRYLLIYMPRCIL